MSDINKLRKTKTVVSEQDSKGNQNPSKKKPEGPAGNEGSSDLSFSSNRSLSDLVEGEDNPDTGILPEKDLRKFLGCGG